MTDGEFWAFESLIFTVAKGFLYYSSINLVKIKGHIRKGDPMCTGLKGTSEDLKVKAGKTQEGANEFFFHQERLILAVRKGLRQMAGFSRKQDVEEDNLGNRFSGTSHLGLEFLGRELW